MVEVVNIKNCPDWGKSGDVLIDRRTKWGNPYKMLNETGRAESIKLYEAYFLKWLVRDIEDLKCAKRLGCWCKPKACHGDVIKKYLDTM